MNSVIFTSYNNKPIKGDWISKITNILGVIPSDYLDLLTKYNVTLLSENEIRTDEIRTKIEYFFGEMPEQNIFDLEWNFDMYMGRMPEHMIPIAEAGGGNLICLYKKNGGIYYWDHEDEESLGNQPYWNNLTKISEDFSSFLLLIVHYDSSDEVANVAGEVISTSSDFDELFKDYLIKEPEKTEVRIHSQAAGLRCPKTGYWYTLAKQGSRRYFDVGDVFPDYPNNSYGDVYWIYQEE